MKKRKGEKRSCRGKEMYRRKEGNKRGPGIPSKEVAPSHSEKIKAKGKGNRKKTDSFLKLP